MDFKQKNEHRDELWSSELEKPRLSSILIKSAIILAFLVAGVVVFIKLNPSEEKNTARGVEMIKELEGQNVAKAETTIRGIREQWTESEAQEMEEQSSNLKTLYQGTSTLLMGDSILVGLSDYGVLDSSSMVFENGASVGEAETAMSTVLTMAPWNLVMDYGLDDVLKYGNNVNGFIEDYTKLINTFHSARPTASIYICAITPVSSEAIEENKEYGNIEIYNAALQKLCLQKNLIFIEVEDMVLDHAAGGVLPSYEFFIPFATRVINTVLSNKSAYTYDADYDPNNQINSDVNQGTSGIGDDSNQGTSGTGNNTNQETPGTGDTTNPGTSGTGDTTSPGTFGTGDTAN